MRGKDAMKGKQKSRGKVERMVAGQQKKGQ